MFIDWKLQIDELATTIDDRIESGNIVCDTQTLWVHRDKKAPRYAPTYINYRRPSVQHINKVISMALYNGYSGMLSLPNSDGTVAIALDTRNAFTPNEFIYQAELYRVYRMLMTLDGYLQDSAVSVSEQLDFLECLVNHAIVGFYVHDGQEYACTVVYGDYYNDLYHATKGRIKSGDIRSMPIATYRRAVDLLVTYLEIPELR